ncbi:hypothetical protein J4231_03420 [Candidatus Woesearchaeota archaeon]|nr:hypothetical protein [Candidatus Woesearchaeota archaeon]
MHLIGEIEFEKRNFIIGNNFCWHSKNIAKNGTGYTFMGLIQRNPIKRNDCPIGGTELVNSYSEFFKWMDANTNR